jgi:eukaryotic-like serine/threonine-protein kinase
VPAVLPAGVAAPTMAMQTDTATTVMPSQAPGFDTMLMGVPGGAPATTTSSYQQSPVGPPAVTGPYGHGDGPQDDGPRKRSAWTIPLIILIVVLAILLVVFLVNTLGAKSTPKASTTAGGGTSSSAPAQSASASSTPVVLEPDSYYGKQFTTVSAQLKALGLTVVGDPQTTTNADDAGKVTKIDPLTTSTGSTVTVTYWGAATTPTAPTSAPTTASKTVTAGATFTVTWSAYTCASGTGGSLSGYTVKVSGDSPNAGDIPMDTTRSTTITAGSTAGKITIAYSANCGAVETPDSGNLIVTVKAPTTATTTPPTSSTPAATDTTGTQ